MKGNKRLSYWKGRNKTVLLFTYDMIVWKIKKKAAQNLELISEFRKLTGYKINIQKSIVFLHT